MHIFVTNFEYLLVNYLLAIYEKMFKMVESITFNAVFLRNEKISILAFLNEMMSLH